MSGEPLAYADFEPGFVFPETRYQINSQDNDAFLGTVRHEEVRSETGQLLAQLAVSAPHPIHPTLLGSYQPMHAVLSWPTGVLHARETVNLFASVYPCEALVSNVTVQDLYERNGKKFVVLRIAIDKVEARQPAMVIERTLVWPY